MLLEERINILRPALAKAAQEVYDAWEQNEEGFCDALGYGGICQDIADEHAALIYEVLDDVEAAPISSNFEQHVYVVVADDDEAVIVDIPPSVYEVGAGFCWKKITGVEFNKEDNVIYKVYIDD